MVLAFFSVGSIHAFTTSRMNKLNVLTRRVFITLHSKLAKHSATSGGSTRFANLGVRPNLSNLSTSRPEQLPISATRGASFSAGIAITHSFVARKAAKL